MLARACDTGARAGQHHPRSPFRHARYHGQVDPVWTAIAEFWWIGPTMIGAGTLGWIGLRRGRSTKARRLAYDASRDALRQARQDAAAARVGVRVARAELSQVLGGEWAGQVECEVDYADSGEGVVRETRCCSRHSGILENNNLSASTFCQI